MGGIELRCVHPASGLTTYPCLIVESVSWVTEDFLWEDEWITETNVTFKRERHIESTEL